MGASRLEHQECRGSIYTDKDRLEFLLRTGFTVRSTCRGDKFFHGWGEGPTQYFPDPWQCLENLMQLYEAKRGRKAWLGSPRGTDGVQRYL